MIRHGLQGGAVSVKRVVKRDRGPCRLDSARQRELEPLEYFSRLLHRRHGLGKAFWNVPHNRARQSTVVITEQKAQW
ncbi:hypothetical protein chiPu_0016069 [Chiloscyllium punctatum]|uniref:Uncharacterized protein n=1 Tax=Chiloscyllium punctatum TaxID=137246 RepID=A0A401T4K6_CHIPU|nr:hypothetical protein [Chiloscyllium punctatum]